MSLWGKRFNIIFAPQYFYNILYAYVPCHIILQAKFYGSDRRWKGQ